MKFKYFLKHFSIEYIYYLFLLVIISILFSSYLYYQKVTEPIRAIVATQNIPKAVSQALLFIFGVVIAAIIILILFIKKRLSLIKYLYLTLFSLGLFFIMSMFLNPLFIFLKQFLFDFSISLILFLILIFSSFLVFSIFFSNNLIIQKHSLLIAACIFGSIIGGILEFIQLIIFLIILSIYDIIAVFIGPIKGIVKEIEKFKKDSNNSKEINLNQITRGMFLEISFIDIGLGDLVLYSALISNFTIVDLRFVLIALIGILVGSLFTIKLANKFKIFPGLPLPVFITLILIWIIS